MKSNLFHQTVTLNRQVAVSTEVMTFADPWEALDEGTGKRDSWLLSYIDILTLFLTLFVVLLALQPKNEAPPVIADPGELSTVSPEPIERRTTPPTLTVQTNSQRNNSETIKAQVQQPAVTDTSGSNETSTDRTQPFTILTSLSEPIISLIEMPLVENPGPVDTDTILPTRATDSVSDTATFVADVNKPEEPATSPSPVPQKNNRNQVQLFMDKLSQQHLDDRVRVSEVAEGVYLEVSDNILFALGSAELKQDGASLLNGLATLLLEHKGIISVEGHTDDRPIANTRFPSNWELSSGRATMVTRYLIGKGLNPIQLRAVGYADTRPLEGNSTLEGRARNRRVALIVEIPESQH